MPHVNHPAGSPRLPEEYGWTTISHPNLEDSEETRTFFQEGFVSLCPLKLGGRFMLACWHCRALEGKRKLKNLFSHRQTGGPHVLVSRWWQNHSSIQGWVLDAICPQTFTVSQSFNPNLWGFACNNLCQYHLLIWNRSYLIHLPFYPMFLPVFCKLWKVLEHG